MNDLRFINLSSYTTPKVVEYKNKEWVAYGEDNNYFKYLIDRYNGSPTNNAIINAISAMIYGRGLDATNSNQKPDEYAKMISLFNADCTRKLCYDLKLMGQCAMQVIYSKDRNTIAQIEHFPVETLRAEKCNDDGDIEAYYYFSDWSKYKPTSKAKRIPAFGTSKEAIEILYVRPYRAGFHYYSPVDYQGGLQYSELEEEIGNFHLNNIMNGMSPSMLINFNNGVPNEEERELIEQRIYQKFSGTSNSGKFILAFNDNAETAANIEPVQLSDAHQQYQFLSEESTRKIMVSHRIVSPMLIGIKDQTGLGNNADELKTASTLLDNTKGEIMDDEWQLLNETPAFDDESEIKNYFEFASVVSGDSRKKDKQDTSLFRIRYKYTAGRSTKGESREFCKKMLAANRVYRMEDLNKQSTANSELAPKGSSTYNIWLYKGGVNCSHYWMRQIYLKKGNRKISVGRARSIISALPRNEKKDARFEKNPPEVSQIASRRNNYWKKS